MKRPSPRSADSDFLSALLHAGLDLEAAFIPMLLKRANDPVPPRHRASPKTTSQTKDDMVLSRIDRARAYLARRKP